MNRQQLRQENEAIQKRYESKYFPLVKAAIQSRINEVIQAVRKGGAKAGIYYLNNTLSNTAVTQQVQQMALEVGLRFARRTWMSLQVQRRNAKCGTVYFIQHNASFNPELYSATVKCPHCGKNTANVESGMGYITCSNCGKTFSSNQNSLQLKGFGFNQAWTDWIKNYLFDFIVTKISFSVFETTKDVLFTVLNEAIREGWGIDETVSKLDALPLPATQAARIVRTEITRAANAGAMAAGSTFPFQQSKEWISAHDDRVRGTDPKDHASHVALDGNVVDYEDYFQDPRNGDLLRFPGDPQASAESTINCRCAAAMIAKIGENGRLIPKQRRVIA